MKVMAALQGESEIEELRQRLKQEADLELCAVAHDGAELIRLAEEQEPDAVFLSPILPEMDGIAAARILLGRGNKPVFVFIAPDGSHAAEAFALDATDYLLAPISPNRWKESVQRLRKRIGSVKPLNKARDVFHLILPVDGKLKVVHPESVIAIVKEEKHVSIHTREGQCYTSKSTLQELEEKLKDYPFFRTHRSYLINLSEVDELIPWFNGAFNVKLRSEPELKVPVSRDSAKELFRRLGGE
jgi:two-component system, LytTR family, response regulator LytT